MLVYQSTVQESGHSQKITLYLVADGMGGHRGGNLASQIAATSFRDSTERQLSVSDTVNLLSALHDANTQIRSEINKHPILRGMGTTLTAVLVRGVQLKWISVGDSPLLLFRDGQLNRLNADHSMLPLLLEEAKTRDLDENYALNHLRRHQLRSALRGQEINLVDQGGISLREDDIFILATDGIETLKVDGIEDVLRNYTPQRLDEIRDGLEFGICDADIPGQDNATFIVFNS